MAVLEDYHEIPRDLIIGNDLLSEWQGVINLKAKLLQGIHEVTSWNIEIVFDYQEKNITDKLFLVHAINNTWTQEYCQIHF